MGQSPRYDLRSMTTTTVRTRTGSLYYITERDDGTFWLSAQNVPNPSSSALHGGSWQIERPMPWPPEQGRGLYLVAAGGALLFVNEKEKAAYTAAHPERLPYGGRYTSNVVEWSATDTLH